ncbi:MAG: thioesterase domain-containing protein [Pseudomonadota bacterium]|nr:thioesterase domain-containing protein [Pseudomonadota bacterium]MDO7711593.1 thioesterase domain-containing protein [Pseudomonadota bacterium]
MSNGIEMDLEQELIYIQQHIPITAHLGVDISLFDGDKIIVTAPLESNKNLHGTAFGGSQAAIGILTGWALIYLTLKQLGITNDLVIQKSIYDFKKPVTADFTATCSFPSEDELALFLNILKEKGKARITLIAEIESEFGQCGRHEGLYVVFLKK